MTVHKSPSVKRSNPYTAENVQYVVKNWNGRNASELATHLGIARNAVLVIVRRARKVGIALVASVRVRQQGLDSILKSIKG